MYQVGAPSESGLKTKVHRFLGGIYYERAFRDQWLAVAGAQYWKGRYSEGANLMDSGSEGLGTATLEDWGLSGGIKYLPTWGRASCAQGFLQSDLSYGQSQYELQVPAPSAPGDFSEWVIRSHKAEGFLRAGVETYWLRSRFVLSAATSYRVGLLWGLTREQPLSFDSRLRGAWLPLEVRAGFRF